MTAVTIQGYKFEVPEGVLAKYDHFLTPEAPDGLRNTVRQTLTENLRNNFAGKVKSALNGVESLNDEQIGTLQTQFTEYANSYEFGIRSGGVESRVKLDPLTKEMLNLAKEDFRKAYMAKYGEKPDKDLVNDRGEELMDKRREDYQKRARAILRQRESVAGDTLESLGM